MRCKGCAAARSQPCRWLPRAVTKEAEEEKIHLQCLQNGLLLPLHSMLECLSFRKPLRMPCCAKGGRGGQHLLQLVFPEGLRACLQPQKLSPHLLWVTARLFSMLTRPCQVNSQFMVSHSCVNSLCFFAALRNLLSIHKPSAHNLFSTAPRVLQTPPLVLLSSALRLASSRVVTKDAILEDYTAGFC